MIWELLENLSFYCMVRGSWIVKQPLVIFVHFHQIYGFSVVCYQKQKNSLHKDSVTWSWYIFQGCLLVSGSLIRFFGDVLGRRFHLCDHHHSSKMVIFLTKWVGFLWLFGIVERSLIFWRFWKWLGDCQKLQTILKKLLMDSWRLGHFSGLYPHLNGENPQVVVVLDRHTTHWA